MKKKLTRRDFYLLLGATAVVTAVGCATTDSDDPTSRPAATMNESTLTIAYVTGVHVQPELERN